MNYSIAEALQSKPTVGVASLYANPLHRGHIEYLEDAKRRCDWLIVIVNNDKQVQLKGSVPFMCEWERARIIDALECVDATVLSIDTDRSVCKTLEALKPDMFFNGGDVRCDKDCRELATCKRLGIIPVFGVGGSEKMQSSSNLIARAIQR